MNGKYERKYQKKQEYQPRISYILCVLFNWKEALQRKHLQLVIILLKSLHVSKKNMYQKEYAEILKQS